MLIVGTGLFVLQLSCQNFLFKMIITFLPSLSCLQTLPHCPSNSWPFFPLIVIAHTYVHTHIFFLFVQWHRTTICFSPRRLLLPFPPSFTQLQILLCIGLRPHGFSLSTSACPLVQSLFSSCSGSHVGKTLWV